MRDVARLALFFTLVLCLLYLPVAHGGESWKDLAHQADSLSEAQDYGSAVLLGTRALDLALQDLGDQDTVVADIMRALGNNHYRAGNYEQALSLHERALAIREAVYGSDHTSVATSLNDLAIACKALGMLDEAESAVERALAIWEGAYGPEDTELVVGLATLGDIYAKQGRLKEAEPLYRKGLTICRENLPADHYTTACLLNNLGWLCMNQGLYAEAEGLNREALEMRERLLDPDHPMIAKNLDNLASVCWRLGRYSEAEALYKRAQAIYEGPPEHPNLAVVLFNLANLYGDEGKLAEAEALYRRAMSIEEKTFGAASPEVGLDLQLIAGIHAERGEYSSADSLYESARKIFEDSFGPDNLYTAGIIQDMATSLQAQGRYSEAEPLYRKAVAVFERDVGGRSAEVACVLTNLGTLCLAQARYTEAESLYTRALSITENVVGPDHPSSAEVCQRLSKYWRVRGEYRKSVDLAERAFQVMRRSFVDNSYDLPEKDALTFSLLMRNAASNCLSCYRDADSTFGESASSACNVVLQSKGQVSDGIFERQRALITETDSVTTAIADSLRRNRFELSRLFVAGPQGDTTGYYGTLVDSLLSQADGVESRLAALSRSFRGWEDSREVSTERVATLLPPDIIIVEYLRYDYYSTTSSTAAGRYLAVVLEGSGECAIEDLGEAGPIDSLVSDYRRHMLRVSTQRHMPLKEDESQYAGIARALYTTVLAPVEDRVLGKAMLLVAPDGDLNLVSFAGLIDGQGRFVVERMPVHYLSAARDLIRLESEDRPGAGLLALGDPDYDAAGIDRLARDEDRRLAAVHRSLTRNVQSDCGEFRRMRVAPLPDTRREIRDAVEQWRTHMREPAVEFLGSLASEENFKAEAAGNRAIHLATHGYFLGARCRPKAVEGGQIDTVFIGENPLLLSGLFLAGANLRGSAYSDPDADDGILTAYEVSGMDLEGVQMVVLSACETGLGEVEEGEGVYGLRRAFQIAGARTVVSALWPVPDDATAEIMAGLYSQSEGLLAERMRAIQLAEIEKLRRQGLSDHPYRWAGFIALGDWR